MKYAQKNVICFVSFNLIKYSNQSQEIYRNQIHKKLNQFDEVSKFKESKA